MASSTPQPSRARSASPCHSGTVVRLEDRFESAPSTALSPMPFTQLLTSAPSHTKPARKKAVTLSLDEDLNDQYLRSCIAKNQSDTERNKVYTEVTLLKKEKLQLEIEILKRQVNQGTDL